MLKSAIISSHIRNKCTHKPSIQDSNLSKAFPIIPCHVCSMRKSMQKREVSVFTHRFAQVPSTINLHDEEMSCHILFHPNNNPCMYLPSKRRLPARVSYRVPNHSSPIPTSIASEYQRSFDGEILYWICNVRKYAAR